jgi:hypothetical protein
LVRGFACRFLTQDALHFANLHRCDFSYVLLLATLCIACFDSLGAFAIGGSFPPLPQHVRGFPTRRLLRPNRHARCLLFGSRALEFPVELPPWYFPLSLASLRALPVFNMLDICETR